MLISQKKKQENIAEYLIYMYQIEDIIRAFQFNLDQIIDVFVKPSLPDSSFLNEYRAWYGDLIHQMKTQRCVKDGHIESLREIVMELIYLHNTLISITNDEKYKNLVEEAKSLLNEFKQKSNMSQRHDVEALLHAMYMKLQLKVRKQEISSETEDAMDKMRIQLAYLSREYHRMKTGSWNFNPN
jgi:phosphoribosylanthranilate isomerase